MKIKIMVEKEMEDWWGIEDLLDSMKGATREEKEIEIIRLIQEDVCSFLDGAVWKIEGDI